MKLLLSFVTKIFQVSNTNIRRTLVSILEKNESIFVRSNFDSRFPVAISHVVDNSPIAWKYEGIGHSLY